MTYLLEVSLEEPIIGGFYELHSVANLDMHLVEKILRKRERDLREMVGI